MERTRRKRSAIITGIWALMQCYHPGHRGALLNTTLSVRFPEKAIGRSWP
jgi:hypothetical protein